MVDARHVLLYKFYSLAASPSQVGAFYFDVDYVHPKRRRCGGGSSTLRGGQPYCLFHGPGFGAAYIAIGALAALLSLPIQMSS